MRPHGVTGLELETVSEAAALAEMFDFAQEAIGPSDSLYDIIGATALAIRAQADIHRLAHGEGSDKTFSLIFAERTSADMALMLVCVIAETNPDPLLRDQAANMWQSYERTVFESATNGTPPESDPPRYRSPFAD